MATISDLNALAPKLAAMMLDHPSIGECVPDGADMAELWTDNFVHYNEDGWCVDVAFRCCGDWIEDRGDRLTAPSRSLKRAWGEVTDIAAYHYDEANDEETVFNCVALDELWDALDRLIKTLTIN